ncbi:hypothetical protein COCCADRAFT_30149 [Bipolaris zeicola 26-R-13]|uniref:Uncharacterized protein n=1 Tax=Cochliobolus carbonum (strain 26-R-13) TaxID=930089 RepID=W6XTF1_COCC2|nr:uncharacterized protein COCCADRAFT_30149 [Bipolaris zeicola 26-R-13]EUC28630.1 hypothetical protein COCCADRAFT_30149 [Bipolaris zeicola 26-R-13]
MKIIELPCELVERIFEYLVSDEQILKRQPLIAYSEDRRKLRDPADRHITIAIDNARFDKLFAQHGNTIIGNEVLRRQQDDSLPGIKYLRDLVDAVLNLEESPVTDDLRKKYTMEICHAVSSRNAKGLRYLLFSNSPMTKMWPSVTFTLPSTLAATKQNARLMEQARDKPAILRIGRSVLPSPLETACACGNVDLVRQILQLESDQTSKEAYGETSRRCISQQIPQLSDWVALCISMRMGQWETGKIFLDRFHAGPNVRTCRRFGTQRLLEEAIKYPDRGFVREILDQRQKYGGCLTKSEMRYIYSFGTPSVLRFLIEKEYIDPNFCGGKTPLRWAVYYQRYDLARVLLQYGARVDGVPLDGKPVTALCRAARTGYRGTSDKPLPGVRFLLENGADPALVEEQVPWPDAEFILQKAREHGNEVALRRETWEEYQRAKSGEREPVLIDLS